MPKLPKLSGKEVLSALLKGGFYVHHQSGSHARLFHSQKPELKATIPIHNKDLPERTFKSILKQANISEEEFSKLIRS